MKPHIPIIAAALTFACLQSQPVHAEESSCAQHSPEEMAKTAGVTLPHLPWHVVNIWWDFEKPVEHFTSLEMDVTIDRDVPSSYNLYISPCGIAKINGLQFYGGIQTNINGWPKRESRERVFPGKGAIFSRWSNDKKTPIGLDHVRTSGDDCVIESAGYEGEFASVRRPFAWTKGTYTYQIIKGETESVGGKACTWFQCRVKDSSGAVKDIGSLRFEGTDFTFWARHSAFVEVYSTAKIPHPGIPKVSVTFGWPRINGEKVPMKKVSAYYPHDQGPAAPDCAWVKADGENCVVEVGPIFKRDEAKRRHDLVVKRADGEQPDVKSFRVELDILSAPECEAFATKSKSIVEEWYPKINEILFGKDHPLPTTNVRLRFEPMKGVAHATKDGIHISAEWVTKKSPNDYGMVVHELTHIVQDYKGKGEGWLTEGIADYVRHVYFEKDADKLARRINPEKSSYKDAYTTAAAFLVWLSEKKDRDIVRQLNAASHDGTYKRELFTQYCGADVDALWKEFTDSLRAAQKP